MHQPQVVKSSVWMCVYDGHWMHTYRLRSSSMVLPPQMIFKFYLSKLIINHLML